VQLLPTLTGDNSASNGAISVPDPGNPLRYYLIYVGVSPPVRLRTTIVDFSNSAFPNGLLVAPDTPISPATIAEHVTVVPKCNGVDYWVIAHQMPQTFLVYSLTAAGISLSGSYAGATGGNGRGVLKASPDGTMLVQAEQIAASALFDFDRATGAIALRTLLPNGNYGASFSPDSKLLYTAGSLGTPNGAIYQYDLTAPNPATTSITILTGINAIFGFVSLELGPDKKIYASAIGNNHLFVINYPNNRITALDPNACGYNFNGPSLQGRTSAIGLPNMIDAQPPAQVPTIASTSSSCLTVAFQAPSCASSYAWDFGDGSTSSAQNLTYSYFAEGTYTVTLTLNGTSSVTQSVTVGLPQGATTIHGPSTVCLSASSTPPPNYSANVHPGLTYQWSATGGVISGPSANNNVDVAWSTLPGTLQLTVTDPATGCVSTNTITVTENCVSPGCTAPPQPIAAWWTFDEITGTTADDIAGYVDDVAGYFNGPNPVAGLVGAALEFNGTGAHLEVSDSPDLNFYGGCIIDFAEPMTIDAWVHTNVPAGTGPSSGLMTLLDKRVTSTSTAALGYSLFLFNGRLGFQIDGMNFVAPAAGPDSIDIADNQWHFVAVVVTTCRGPSNSYLYVDGKVVLRFRRSGGFVNNAKLYIGASNPVFGANYFRGSLDELEIFKAALPEDQLRTIFEARDHGKCRPDCSQKTIAIAPATLSVLKRGLSYFPAATFTASGGTAPYSFAVTAGTLPPGMSLGWDGDLTGTPATGGTYTFTVATIDADGCRSTKTYQLFVSGKHYAVRH
jgi:PKD repeat protein